MAASERARRHGRAATSCRVASDTIRISRTAGVVTATASGLLGVTECMGLVSRLHEAVSSGNTIGVILDVRGAALAISTSQYVDIFNAALSDRLNRLALVVGPGLMSVSRGHQTLMARRGLDHRVFTHVRTASAWVRSDRSAKTASIAPQDDASFQRWKVGVMLVNLGADGGASGYEWTEAERRALRSMDSRPYAQLSPAEQQALNDREHRLLLQDDRARRSPGAAASRATKRRGNER